uniref:Secreted protein with PEP-CTERM sorting signal n=1 Tax=Desulfobacca acetoxidans TaxID=60893 RepID=A0A7V4LD43_9BACT
MKRLSGCLMAVMLLMGVGAAPALAATYFIYDQYGGTWHDANKTAANTEDDLMCWAATASNILAWGGWGTAAYNTSDQIFKHFQDHWTDNVGYISWGWAWWFNGFNPEYRYISYIDVPGGGNFYPHLNLNDYYASASGPNVMADIANLLRLGKGVGLVISNNMSSSHAVTAWGFGYSADGLYTSIFFTDSDDGLTALREYSLIWQNDGWYLKEKLDAYGGYSLNGWKISYVQALGYFSIAEAADNNSIDIAASVAPVPLAPSWVFFGMGVGALFLLVRRRLNQQNSWRA